MQQTFMMLKPDAFESHHQDDIIKDLEDHNLIIKAKNLVEVDMDVMKILLEHYHQVIDEKGKDFNFPGKLFNSFYFEGPHYVMPMIVEYNGEQDIIEYTRKLVGKTNPCQAESGTIRAAYSQDNYEIAESKNRLVANVIHASDSHESAKREIDIWKMLLY